MTTSIAVTRLGTLTKGGCSVSVQAFFQGDTDPAIPRPGSASWVRLWHSCGYLERGLPGRTGDNTGCAWEVTGTKRSQAADPQHPPAVQGGNLPG